MNMKGAKRREKVKELIYAGTKVENLVKKQFPGAKIIDASDMIHHERFEIELDEW